MSSRADPAISRRRWWTRHWILLVVALGVVARCGRVALGFPIWGDEAFVACNFLSRDLHGLLQPLEFEMVVPLGWLVPTHALSRLLGADPWVLRLPALAAGIAALLLFVGFARRAIGRTAGLAAAALFAASYYLVRHSAEVKPYAFDLLAGLLVTTSAWRLVAQSRWTARSPRPAREWAVFAAVSVVAVWCSYPVIFVAAGALLVLGGAALCERGNAATPKPRSGEFLVPRSGEFLVAQRRSLLPWLLASCAIAASFLAMYLLIGRHQQWSEERIADARHWDEHFLPLTRPWLWPWWLLRELTGNMLAYPNGGPNFGSSATFLLVVTGAISLWRRGRRCEVLLLASPLLPMLAASALRKYPFGGSARITLHLAVPVCLFAATGFVALLRAWRGARAAVRGARVFTLAMALWLVATIATDCVRPYKTIGDVNNRDALAGLRDQSRRGDRWLIFGRFAALTPSAWAEAPDLAAWRGSAGRLHYYLLLFARAAGAEIEWAPPPASLAASPGHTVWLVAYRDNESAFPEAAWSQYRDALVARLGTPGAESRSVLGPASPDARTGAPRVESLTFLRFDPTR